MGVYREILIEQHWLHKLPRSVCDIYTEHQRNKQANDSPHITTVPIIYTSKYIILSVVRQDIHFVTVLTTDINNVLYVYELLYYIVDIFLLYFNNVLNESIIRENFSTIYMLLDEVIDCGYPFTTDINQLQMIIAKPSLQSILYNNILHTFNTTADTVGLHTPSNRYSMSSISNSITSKIPWRSSNIQYISNEIYFDIVESIDGMLDSSGRLLYGSIYGELNVNCRLTGMPDLTLSFTRPSLLHNANLHRCVRINRYQRDTVLSFVPPDGEFVLCEYKVDTNSIQTQSLSHTFGSHRSNSRYRNSAAQSATDIQVPVSIRPIVTYTKGHGRVYISVSSKLPHDRHIQNIRIVLPLPPEMLSTDLKSNYGSVHIDSAANECVWTIGKLGSSERLCSLDGNIVLPSNITLHTVPVCRVEFLIKTMCLSGVKVDGLAIRNVNYKPFKGVKSTTQAGRLQIRCSNV